MFKKGIIATALLLTAGTAIADDNTIVKNLGQHERMANASISIDYEMTDKIKAQHPSLDGYIVNVSGSRLLSNEDGTLVSQLKSIFDTATMQDLQTSVNYALMEKEANRNWFDVPLADGIQKQADVYVFSDSTCGYCKKMHTEKAQYDAYGIQMHIIPYPRSGLRAGTPGYDNWVKTACAVNIGQVYHDGILSGVYPEISPEADVESCKAEVERGYRLGREFGISGTPFKIAYAVNGSKMMAPGYIQVDKLAAELNISMPEITPEEQSE
tara:strand:+ start:6759 stop:7565 length:807 start_codon:yes stop_codon:yes gene_type:complete